MRRYETTFILRPGLGENGFSEVIDRTRAILTADGGVVLDESRWGLKKLAYEIKKETQGYYVYLNYVTEPAAMAEMERIFRLDDRVLRYLTVKLADEVDPASLRPADDDTAAETGEEAAALEEAADGPAQADQATPAPPAGDQEDAS